MINWSFYITAFSMGLINSFHCLAMLIFCISPFLMIWLVLTILRDKSFKYPELPPGQHWGYRGKNKDDLGVF